MAGGGEPFDDGAKIEGKVSAQTDQTRQISFAELESNVEIFEISGFVKWFDVARGYGFIIPDSGIPDVLLHLSCLKRDGFDAPLEGTRVVCEAVQRQKGIQCLRVVSVDNSTAIHPVERTARTHQQVEASHDWVRVKVKWFNRIRGFGFASEGEGKPDIFIHMEVLRKTAIAELEPDQWVYVRFGDGAKGKMAAEVRLSLDNNTHPVTN
ncbi:MAG: cold shock domain-containing protein [Anderseniella sp.]